MNEKKFIKSKPSLSRRMICNVNIQVCDVSKIKKRAYKKKNI